MREVQGGEFAMQTAGAGVVGVRRLFSRRKSAEAIITALCRNACAPAPIGPADTPKAAFAKRTDAVRGVFRWSGFAQIGPAIVQSIAIDVVDEFAGAGPQNLVMQAAQIPPLMEPGEPDGVGSLVRVVFSHVPKVPTEPLHILGIDKREVPAGEWKLPHSISVEKRLAVHHSANRNVGPSTIQTVAVGVVDLTSSGRAEDHARQAESHPRRVWADPEFSTSNGTCTPRVVENEPRVLFVNKNFAANDGDSNGHA